MAWRPGSCWHQQEDDQEAQKEATHHTKAEPRDVGGQREDKIIVGQDGDAGEGSAGHCAARLGRLEGTERPKRPPVLRDAVLGHLHHLDDVSVGADFVTAV